MTGKTEQEVRELLKGKQIEISVTGTEETVTGQLPAAGTMILPGSRLLLYFGSDVPTRQVQVPDFKGMNRQQANDAAGLLGLSIVVAGSETIAPYVIVTDQKEPAGTTVDVGTAITLQFTDTTARD